MKLAIDHLTLAYGQKVIINDLSLEFPEGITALIGPNGCGKSTLLKAVARLLTPQAGKITLDGNDIAQYSQREFARQLALLPQQQIVPEGISVRELVGYGRSPYLGIFGKLSPADYAIVDQALALTKLEDLKDCLVTDLSGGQRQRVFLAMALAQDAPYILLDEPTTYLDLNHQTELMHLMRAQQEQGKTIITVLHDLNQAARYCDYLVMLKDGELIAQGTPEQVMTPELLQEVFDLEGQVHQDPISGTPMFISY